MPSRAVYLLYAATVFLSSFLLFAVQPLLGKHILPWFGGTASVWITALFFFMLALALGYLYALLLSHCSRSMAVITHISVVLSTGVLMWRHADWPSAITPFLDQAPVTSFEWPALAVCATLALSIGLPFVLLSSTSSLLQYWYGATEDREPFSLYAVSNAGSLFGLLSYPVFFEPFLSTYAQGDWWSVGFFLYCGLLLVVMGLVVLGDSPAGKAHAPPSSKLTLRRFLVWLALASVPVVAMLTATSHVSGYIAPIPFLWVVSLCLYLISFMVSFREGPRLPPFLTYTFTVFFSTATLVFLCVGTAPTILSLVLIYTSLFLVCHFCHETLYHLRPEAIRLTQFYVALALGGILGSTLVLVLSLFVLPMPFEFYIIIAGAAVTSGYLLRYDLSLTDGSLSFRLKITFWFLILLVVSSLGVALYGRASHLLAQERNFFGYKAIYEEPLDGFGPRRTLAHGTTVHGYQFPNSTLAAVPVAYYGETSGVGRSLMALRGENGRPLEVAVIGLGVGTMASYCQEGDGFDFFEIDPEVIVLARDHFTYLDLCPQANIQVGDGRLHLEAKRVDGQSQIYDLIVIDAYADDTAPVHLMTKEAVALYTELLDDDGVIAVHISSRYLDLSGVTAGLSAANHLAGRYYFDTNHPAYAVESHWILFAKTEATFGAPQLEQLPSLSEFKPIFWTDTYSALSSVIKLW